MGVISHKGCSSGHSIESSPQQAGHPVVKQSISGLYVQYEEPRMGGSIGGSTTYKPVAKVPSTDFFFVPSGPGQRNLPSSMRGWSGAKLSISFMNGNAMLVSTFGGLDIQQQDYTERKEDKKEKTMVMS